MLNNDDLTALQAWRDRQTEDLRADDGWLTLTGLFMLQEGVNSVGYGPDHVVSLPAETQSDSVGQIDFRAGVATFHAADGLTVLVDGVAIRDLVLRDDSHGESPTVLTIDTVSFFVIKRGESYAVRVRDRENPARLAFAGRRWFDPNPALRVSARFVSHPALRHVSLETSIGSDVMVANIGFVTFTLEGQPLQLEAFSETTGELWFIFKDQSSGKSTYGAGRFLRTSLTADGLIDLDFNRAYSPPCAFTPFATCPLPPRANHLPVSILAGEKL